MTDNDVFGYIVNVYSTGYLGMRMFSHIPSDAEVREVEAELQSNDNNKTLISKVNRTRGTYIYTTNYWRANN